MSLDEANSAFQKLSADVAERLSTIETEQDARLQLIDRLLVEVLGWDHAAIKTEPHSPSGYTDYLLNIGGQPRFVLEAKRTGKALLDTLNPSYRTYKVSSPALSSASDGIKQAAGYCLDHGVDFSVVTTGLLWIAFLPFPSGKSYREGIAIVFPSLAAIRDNFAAFYDLFSKEGVSKKLYKLHFAKAEGLTVQQYDPMSSVNRKSDLRLLAKSSLAADLDPVFREFFGSLSGDSDKDMLLECFVETPESRHADAALEKLLRDISAGVSTIETGTGSQITREIENAVSTMRGDTIVIVGNKGAGKSTFVERFFELVLDRSIRDQCLVINIYLLKSNGDIAALPAWLAVKVRAALEAQLFENSTPTYDQLKGIYHSEYTKWRDGQFAPLYKTDKDAFEIKFGEFLDSKINLDDFAFILRLLDHVVKSRRRLPCIVLDNADHYPEAFQEAAFQWTQSIRTEIPFSLVVVPVTDRTIWRLSKAGPFQTYRSKLFYLPVPSTKDVLGKRISYLKKQTNTVRDTRSYFLQKGIRLSVDNIRAFAACSEEIFLNEPFISRRIGWLSNHDIRRSLLISQQVLTSPHLSIDDLVGAYLKLGATAQVKISYRKFMQALIQGEYNAFQQDNSSFVLNIFDVSPDFPSTPLLRLSILKLLIDRAGEQSGVGSYVPVTQIYSYCDSMGISDDAVRAALNVMLSYRLAEPYDASALSSDDAQQLMITHSGRMHYEMATTDLLYVSQMAFSTSLRATSVVEKLGAIKRGFMANKEWVEIRRIFLVYCMAQDRSLARLPNDKIFDGQRQLRQDLQQRWVLNRNPSVALTDEEIPPEVAVPERTGRDDVIATVKWFDEKKGFGFLTHPEMEDIFIHKRVLRAKGIDTLTAGDNLRCDIGPGEKGRFQVIHLHSLTPAAVPLTEQDQEWRVGTLDFFNSNRGYGFVKVQGIVEDVFLPGRIVDASLIPKMVQGFSVEVQIGRDSRGTGHAVCQLRLSK